MAWLTAEWADYWCDIYGGKYAKPVQEPALELIFTPEDIGRFLEESDLMAGPGEKFEAFVGQYPELTASH